MQTSEKLPTLRKNPFQLDERFPQEKPSPSKTDKEKEKKGGEKKKQLLSQLARVKFLWQIYQLRRAACPILCKLGEGEEALNRKEML